MFTVIQRHIHRIYHKHSFTHSKEKTARSELFIDLSNPSNFSKRVLKLFRIFVRHFHLPYDATLDSSRDHLTSAHWVFYFHVLLQMHCSYAIFVHRKVKKSSRVWSRSQLLNSYLGGLTPSNATTIRH